MKNKGLLLLLGMVLAAAILVTAGWWYRDYRQEASRKTYFVTFDDVKGLKPGAEVRLHGLTVGEVRAIELDPEQQRARVAVRIDPRVELNRDASFALTSDGLLGENLVVIEHTGASGERAKEGQTWQAAPQPGLKSFFSKLDSSLDEIVAGARSLKEVEERLQRVEQKLDVLLARTR
jgi:ABC-type transporter Mla subunit MlaD